MTLRFVASFNWPETNPLTRFSLISVPPPRCRPELLLMACNKTILPSTHTSTATDPLGSTLGPRWCRKSWTIRWPPPTVILTTWPALAQPTSTNQLTNLPPTKFSFSPKAVSIVIDHLNVKKSPGADLLSDRMLRELPYSVIFSPTRIFNVVLRLQTFPTVWKGAKMIMLPKPGKDPSTLQSYRPISLLSVLSKVFEKLLHRQLLALLPPLALPYHQFGFRARRWNVDQLQRVTSTILSSLEKKFCAAAFNDVTQAFDRIWHEGLAVKLSQLLLTNVCQLLASYLENCPFFVIYGE